MTPLRDAIPAWTDSDGVAHILARSLGILPPDVSFQETKHIYWARNELGDCLYDVLHLLVAVGVLEYDEDELRYRANANFVWHQSSTRGGR